MFSDVYWVIYERSTGLPVDHGDCLSALSVKFGYDKNYFFHVYKRQQSHSSVYRSGFPRDYIIERIVL